MECARVFLLLLPAVAARPAAAMGAAPYSSKIGIHLLVSYTPGAEKIVRAKCPIIKLLDVTPDMMRALADYRAANPEGTVVLRIYTPVRYSASDNAEQKAKEFWDSVLWPQLSRLTPLQRSQIDYVEGPNECDTTPCWASVDDVKWFTRFWVALAPLMARHHFRPCIGSIPVGNPPGPPKEVEAKIREFIPALKVAKKLGGSWCYHSYTLKYTKDPEVERHYSLRYRSFYEILAKHAPELGNLPMLLTEGGVDNDGSHPENPGWKRDSAEKFQDWLKWFDCEIGKDTYIKGVTLFQIGDPRGWGSFDLEPMADWLASYLSR